MILIHLLFFAVYARKEKARIIQSGGATAHIPHIPHNTSADEVGKPEGLSGSQTEDLSLLKNKTPGELGEVNGPAEPTPTGPTRTRPDGVAGASNNISPSIPIKCSGKVRSPLPFSKLNPP